jgi:hypothetical protein
LECNILGLPHQLKTVPETKLFQTVEKEAARGGGARQASCPMSYAAIACLS